MVDAVVFAFAETDGLKPVVGAAPYDVLARQLPRLLVVRLNAGTDHGVRYFPFLANVDGTRTFLGLRQRFEPKQLADLHKQGDVRFLCDGQIRNGILQWRVIDGDTLRVCRDVEIPFDPASPTEVLTRLEFELMELLGISGRPHDDYGCSSEAIGWLLILRDGVLRREAGLDDSSQDPLRAARKCVELAPCDPQIVEVVIDVCTHYVRESEHHAGVAEVLRQLADLPELPTERFERLSALLLSVGEEGLAATVSLRAARAAVDRTDLVERSVGLLFRLGRYAEAADLLEMARQRGVASITALAQHAACCDRLGDQKMRAQICDELLREHDLPNPVARLLVSFLLEDERADVARAVARRSLQKDPAQPVLHFEFGRACLSLDDCELAVTSLREAIDRGLPAEFEPRARRLLRLAAEPGLWRGSQAVEQAIARGDLQEALDKVVELVRRDSRVAEVWFLAGLVRHKQGDTSRAERALRRAVRMDETLADAHNRLGILLVARGDAAGGLPYLERAHALAPNETSPMLHLAQALACLGRVEEANRYIDAAAAGGADAALVDAVRREVLSARR